MERRSDPLCQLGTLLNFSNQYKSRKIFFVSSTFLCKKFCREPQGSKKIIRHCSSGMPFYSNHQSMQHKESDGNQSFPITACSPPQTSPTFASSAQIFVLSRIKTVFKSVEEEKNLECTAPLLPSLFPLLSSQDVKKNSRRISRTAAILSGRFINHA